MVSGAARIAGVIGWPISHSLSPRLHGFWIAQYGIDGAYVPLAVTPESILEAIRALPKLGFRGANVTVPHKQAACEAMDEISKTAQRLNAVNTIIVRQDGSLFGDNTDGFGFIENLVTAAGIGAVADQSVVVLGAGGAARGVVAALIDAGASSVRVVNRTESKAQALSNELDGNIFAVGWNEMDTALADATLLVNTTSLGMTGQPPLQIDFSPLSAQAIVTDIVYNPLRTPLLKQAEDVGFQVVDGLGMLLHQARPGFAAWFGREPDVTSELRAHVLAGLSE